jgi:hypothetical protein
MGRDSPPLQNRYFSFVAFAQHSPKFCLKRPARSIHPDSNTVTSEICRIPAPAGLGKRRDADLKFTQDVQKWSVAGIALVSEVIGEI